MKRLLIVGIPLTLVVALMFVRPPSFAPAKATTPVISTGTTGTSGSTTSGGIMPGVSGSGDDDDKGKPTYGGHDADDYDD